MNYEKPTWRRFDSIRSVFDLGKTALLAFIDRKDTEYANACNSPEDEQ